MNQDELDVVKQQMTRVNMDILRISELKWTEMCEFTSDNQYYYIIVVDYYIIPTTVGKNPLEKNEVAIIVNKRV